MIILAGVGLGFFFGYLLYKIGMFKYDFQVSAMRFKNFGMFKFYMSAQVSAWICILFLSHLGYHPNMQSIFRPINAIVGGLIFGIGWGTLGYCPGTCAVAAAMGKMDGIVGFLGIFFGVFFGIEISDILDNTFKLNKLIIINITEPLFFKMIYFLIIIYFIIFSIFERNGVKELEVTND